MKRTELTMMFYIIYTPEQEETVRKVVVSIILTDTLLHIDHNFDLKNI